MTSTETIVRDADVVADPESSGPAVATEGVAMRRVLAWSGPEGWRDHRPHLVPRSYGVPASDAGFSLVELMVALLVMAILLAIAIPTFLGTTGAAADRSVQTNLVTGFTDAKAQFQSGGQTYGQGAGASAALALALDKDQPDLNFGTGSSDSESDISVAVSSDGVGVVLAAYSVPGNCFYVVDNTSGLSPASSSAKPYVGAPAGTTTPRSVSHAIGLPTVVGTSYVRVAGDSDWHDCNASSPEASVAGVSAQYQADGFPS